jgi:mannose-6-phosphate isomerase-like protein (cupin superfamily)
VTTSLVLMACASSPPTPAASASASAFASASASASASAPVDATFLDLTATPAPIAVAACQSLFLSVARGKASALGETLAEGDTILARNVDAVTVSGDGLALVAKTTTEPCEADRARSVRVARAHDRPGYSWAHGTMHADLDFEKDASPAVYFGRLTGTAAVPEHAHDGAWEILCAIDGAGTLVVAGAPQRLAPRGCVFIPPNAKHTWTPDAGSSLRGLQMYAPPGPEQRFKKLAATPTN